MYRGETWRKEREEILDAVIQAEQFAQSVEADPAFMAACASLLGHMLRETDRFSEGIEGATEELTRPSGSYPNGCRTRTPEAVFQLRLRALEPTVN